VSALVNAWQAVLAAEHQAVFGYAVAGPHLRGADLQLAVTCSDAHETLRDRTAAALDAAGLTPVAPLADYPALYPVTDAGAARRLGVRLEDDCAAAWRYLYAAAVTAASGSASPSAAATTRARSLRGSAQAALTASAVRATRWRALVNPARPTSAFPGI
jgi:Domain of unknown function (DUF4439)